MEPINNESSYSLLRTGGLINAESLTDEAVKVSAVEVKTIPGFWIYSHYSTRRLYMYRALYTLGYCCEACSYVADQILLAIVEVISDRS